MGKKASKTKKKVEMYGEHIWFMCLNTKFVRTGSRYSWTILLLFCKWIACSTWDTTEVKSSTWPVTTWQWLYKTMFLQWGWLSTGTGCPERLWSLHPQRQSKDIWSWPWATCSGGPCLSRGLDQMTARDTSNLNCHVILWQILLLSLQRAQV